MKFGGTSVGDAARMAGVAQRVTEWGKPCLVVVSAMGGTTDVLLEAGRRAEAGDLEGARACAASLRARHLEVAGDAPEATVIDALVDELVDLLRGVALLREQTPRSRAMLASFGERLSAPLVALACRTAGHESEAWDARDLIVTNDQHESAVVDMKASTTKVQAALAPRLQAGVVPVVTGFLGATADGVTTVLGRGGSDYTASLLGAMLGAEEVWIWTDVAGIQTADPRVVRDARTLDQVSFREAAEMSYFGAKVVHPKTMLPAMERGIPLRIRSSFEPDHPGTCICDETVPALFGVKTVTSIRHQALVSVEGRGIAGIVGVARRIFGCAEDAGVNVVMISQASSEQTVSFVVQASDADVLMQALSTQFALELEAGLLDPIQCRRDVAVLSAIGQGMAGHVGTSARLFSALAHSGVNVLAIAQGASELSISAAIDASDVVRGVRAVHRAFGLTRSLDVFVLGAGRVAASFVRMLEETKAELADSLRVSLRLIGLANSRRCVIDGNGVSPSEAMQRLEVGTDRPGDEALLDALDAQRHGPLVLVDLTAADTALVHGAALDRAFHVVTANKRPLSGSMAAYEALVQAVRMTGATYGYETTFGAGLPVLHTLKE